MVLAGRSRELEAVVAVLVGDTDAAALVLAGEAGVGKSRLLAAAAGIAAESDVLVLTGRCLPLSRGLPFLPVVEVLRELSEVDDGALLKSVLSNCPEFVRRELVQVIPELEEPGEPVASANVDEGWRRRRLFEALRRLLDALARARHVALVVEDVHWADPTTLEFLDYLLAARGGVRDALPVVLTCRSEETPTPSLTDWLERLHRDPAARRLDLAAMSRAETAEQVELLLGARAPGLFVDELFARSEGNAFFTEQLVSSAGAGPAGRASSGGLPADLTTLLLSRTAEVSGVAGEIIAVLAVASRPLPEAALAQLCGRATGEVREGLRELLARRLLRHPDVADLFELRHALLAEAVRGELLPGERHDLHARIAQLMAGWDQPGLASQICEHFARADRTTDELGWRITAARAAETVHAPQEAAWHWRRAISLWDAVPDAESMAGMGLAEVYLRAVATSNDGGDSGTASCLAEAAVLRFASAVDGQTAVALYSELGRFRGIDAPEAGLASLATAIEIGDRMPASRAYIWALHHSAQLMRGQGRSDDFRGFIVRALEASNEAGDLSQQKVLLSELALDAVNQGRIQDGINQFARAAEFIIVPEDPPAESYIAAVHTDLLLKVGELNQVVTVGLPAIGVAEAAGQADSFVVCILRDHVCEALVELGEVGRAASLVDPATGAAPRRDDRLLYVARADLDMRRGLLSAAECFWNDNRDLLESITSLGFRLKHASVRLELCLWLGRPRDGLAEALTQLDPICRSDVSQFAGDLLALAMRACADLAERGRSLSDGMVLERALLDGARLDVLRAEAKIDPFGEGLVPVTARANALTWTAEKGRLQDGGDHAAWAATVAAWDALDRPHRTAYARWRQAEALLATPHNRGTATDVIRAAAAQAIQHVPLNAAIHDLARRARIVLTEPTQARGEEAPAPPALPVTPASLIGLTDRELAVLRLLGSGKTNAEIGRDLFISPKTASVHVTNILRKLHVTSRVQAATVAERAGLLDP